MVVMGDNVDSLSRESWLLLIGGGPLWFTLRRRLHAGPWDGPVMKGENRPTRKPDR